MKEKIINPNCKSKIGDILWGKNNINPNSEKAHYMVFIESSVEGTEYFNGAMLTTSDKPKYSNILMQKEHFKEFNQDGIEFKVKYKSSYIVPEKLIKKVEWAPFEKVGELTEQGIDFIKMHIGGKEPIFYTDLP